MSHWILQENFMNENKWIDLVNTLERFNIPYSVHKVVPFVGDIEPDFDIDNKNVMCFGSYSMRHIAKKKGWNPGVYDLEEFDFIEQMKYWNKHMLNSDSDIVEFKDVKIDKPTFIRPIKDSKIFSGRVFDPEEFNEWQYNVVELNYDYGTSLENNTLVQVCKPKEIYQEVRTWIVDQQIVTASVYKIGNRVIYSDKVDQDYIDFAYGLISPISVDCWNPARAFVLDICLTPDGLKVVEINTINSCGLYACDVQKLVLSLNI